MTNIENVLELAARFEELGRQLFAHEPAPGEYVGDAAQWHRHAEFLRRFPETPTARMMAETLLVPSPESRVRKDADAIDELFRRALAERQGDELEIQLTRVLAERPDEDLKIQLTRVLRDFTEQRSGWTNARLDALTLFWDGPLVPEVVRSQLARLLRLASTWLATQEKVNG